MSLIGATYLVPKQYRDFTDDSYAIMPANYSQSQSALFYQTSNGTKLSVIPLGSPPEQIHEQILVKIGANSLTRHDDNTNFIVYAMEGGNSQLDGWELLGFRYKMRNIGIK